MPKTAATAAESLPLGPGVALLASDAAGFVALDKPPGVLSHPNPDGGSERALLSAPYDAKEQAYTWRDAAGAQHGAWLLNRLDSATSGVILLALGRGAAAAGRGAFLHRRVRKVYVALVFGTPRRRVETWRDRLQVEKSGGRIRTAAGGGLESECRFRLLRAFTGTPPLALVELEPRTGRSHQLRVQCALRHFPIVGDQTYGNFPLNRAFAAATGERRLFLHSAETELACDLDGRRHSFRARSPVPPGFTAYSG